MPQLENAHILSQLDRVLNSADFSSAPRQRKFLTHLVQEELAGRGARLKGTAIAMDVFERGVDFDSNNDPVVRIEAIKLRKALEHYYLTSGVDDDIIITVNKGQYRPTFAAAAPKAAPVSSPVTSLSPSIFVLAFSGSDTSRAQIYRSGLPEELALELSRFSQLDVFAGWNGATDLTLIGDAQVWTESTYLLGGTVRDIADRLRVTVQLSRQSDGLLVWSERFDLEAETTNVFEVQETIARNVAVKLGDAYGVVGDDLGLRATGRQSVDAGVYEALLAFQRHMRSNRRASLSDFVELAQDALKGHKESGLAHALVAISELEKMAMGVATPAEIVAAGQSHAEQAVALAPHCQEALFSGAIFALLTGDRSRFERLIEAATSVNPNGSLLIALAGSWVAACGDIDIGGALVRKAVAVNPLLPAWTAVTLALMDIRRGNYDDASALVARVDARDCASDWVIIAAAHGLAGKTAEAEAALAAAHDLGMDIPRYLSELPLEDQLKATLQDAIRAV